MDLDLEYELDMIQALIKPTMDEEEYIFKFTEAFQQFGFELKSQTIKRPDPPYRGDEPYIFINFALGDADLVFGEIKRLQDNGLNVFWHDNSFSSADISDAIENSSLVISFMSPTLVRLGSTRDEIDLALMANKPIILIYLNKTDLPAALKLLLEEKESILQYGLVESEYLIQLNDSLKRYGFEMMSEVAESDIVKVPFKPYEGSERYIFVSYAHADAKIVFPEIKRFHDAGYPICYDYGLNPSSEWYDDLANALSNCSLLIIFFSANSVRSNNVNDEIRLALNMEIDIVPIYLEEVQLPLGLELRLANRLSIFKHVIDDEDYISKCFNAFDAYKIPKIDDQNL